MAELNLGDTLKTLNDKSDCIRVRKRKLWHCGDSIQLQELCSWQMSNASIWTSTPPLKRQWLKNGWDDILWKNHLDQENLPALHIRITHIQLCKGAAMASGLHGRTGRNNASITYTISWQYLGNLGTQSEEEYQNFNKTLNTSFSCKLETTLGSNCRPESVHRLKVHTQVPTGRKFYLIHTCPSPKNKATAQNTSSHQLRSQRIYLRAEDVGEATLTFYQALKYCFRRPFATFTNWSKHAAGERKHTQKIPSQSFPIPAHKLMTDRRISKKWFLTPEWQRISGLHQHSDKKKNNLNLIDLLFGAHLKPPGWQAPLLPVQRVTEGKATKIGHYHATLSQTKCVFLIPYRKCGLQYVGETNNSLGTCLIH